MVDRDAGRLSLGDRLIEKHVNGVAYNDESLSGTSPSNILLHIYW